MAPARPARTRAPPNRLTTSAAPTTAPRSSSRGGPKAVRQPRSVNRAARPPAPPPREAAVLPARPLALPPPSPQYSVRSFDLADHLANDDVVGHEDAAAAHAPAPPDHMSARVMEELARMRDQIARLVPAPSNNDHLLDQYNVPLAVRNLTSGHYSEPAKKEKNGFYPSPNDQLTAHRLYRNLNTDQGKLISPTSFVLTLSESDHVRFAKNPMVFTALYAGRLGSRGASVMNFTQLSMAERLIAQSNNDQLILLYGKKKTESASKLKSATHCSSYHQLLEAIDGLHTFASTSWFPWGVDLVHRIREFVLNAQYSDNTADAYRVQMTVGQVDEYLGRALGFLQHDGGDWLANFHGALSQIDANSSAWLNKIVNYSANVRAPPPDKHSHNNRPTRSDSQHADYVGIPPEISKQIPKMLGKNGKIAPCLKAIVGSGCISGPSCANGRRLHTWPTPIPEAVKHWFLNRPRASRSAPDSSA